MTTLTDFIAKRKDLLTALSVFAALTLFARNLTSGILGEILAVLFLAGFIFLWLELWSSFPKDGTRRLALFEDTIVFSGIAIMVYWFGQLKTFSTDFFILYLTLPIVYFITDLASNFIKSRNVFNRLFHAKDGEKRGLRHTFGLVLVLIIFVSVYSSVGWAVRKYETKIDEAFNYLFQSK